jgi:RNA polymerase sigma factor (sigma-70 family)
MASPLLYFDKDARLLDRLRNGDEEVLVEFYDENRAVITAYILRNSGSQADADDMLQEAVVILWERVRCGRYEHTAKTSTFLYAIVKNLWSRRLARKRRELSGETDPDDTADPAESPLEALMETEQAGQVQQALSRIGEPCRSLLSCSIGKKFYGGDRNSWASPMLTQRRRRSTCKKALERALKEVALMPQEH